MIRMWWYIHRACYAVSTPLNYVTEYAREKREITANQYWIDHPEGEKRLTEALLKHIDEHRDFLK